jgi:cyanophycinase-like exopeptidase
MLRGRGAVTIHAALLALAACAPTNDGIRVIQSNGPVYEVSARGGSPVKPAVQPAGRGTIILEGGGAYLDEASALTVAEAGPKPVICLIDTAAEGKGDPYRKFDAYDGVQMLTLNITPSTAADPQVIEALDRCTGYFFDGGNPDLLSKGLLVGTSDSRSLAVIRNRFERAGAVVAGTGTGAMIAGPITLCECNAKSSIKALTTGLLYQAPGYRFVDKVLVDTNFFTRGLIGRDLYALAKTGGMVSVGIDEGAAVVVPGDGGLWQVIGNSSVAFIQRGPKATAGRLKDFTISLLNAGDRFDPISGRVAVARTRKPQTLANDPAAGPLQVGGIFEPDGLRRLITQFAAGPNPTAQGYAETEGLVIGLGKRADTAVFSDGSSTSVMNLDIEVSHF